ncbi:MAG TPA: hypothetical protein VFD80_02340 [Flavobacteriaceae bacterium]|nr:hypothetical protein [Flavobacteriaceae bacterium]
MASPAKKTVRRKNPQKTMLIFVMILLVGVIAIQLFYPQKMENGKLTRLGGSKPSPAPTKSPKVETTDVVDEKEEAPEVVGVVK